MAESWITSTDTTEVKIIVLGDSAVGKTSFVKRICAKDFGEWEESPYRPTIATLWSAVMVDCPKSMPVSDCPEQMRLVIWDTAGSATFRALTSLYVTGTEIAVIMVDLTNEESIHGAREWTTLVREVAGKNTRIIFVANKIDLLFNDITLLEYRLSAVQAIAEQLDQNSAFMISVKEAQGLDTVLDCLTVNAFEAVAERKK